ncbi:MAG: cation diffusion facilitator family transporter [Proteobacteria bacterium]|nr:cation diffusion facilitator family transporter [Pseudomonadota bacterium]
MKILEAANRSLGKWFIEGFTDTDNKKVRIQHGLLAGWVSIFATLSLFVVKMVLGLKAGSISVVADAFHLLSHLANSIILVVSFWVTSRPATAKTPFGHGRMEHVAPLIMSVFLFVSGIQIGERSVHQVFEPHTIHYWTALPWILLATILVKELVGQFVRYLGKRVSSHAILANAFHHRIEAVITLTVIGGLVAGHHYHRPELDGYIGILVSAWLLYLGFDHGREAIVPLLGKSPDKDILQKIRETAKSVEGIQDVHEIILHDYGSMYLISAHVEVPEKFGSANMHEITERCEAKLRKTYGGEAVCHTDPLLEKTSEAQAVEAQFKKIVERSPHITGYHDFRLIAESPERIIIVADIDVAEEVPEAEFEAIAADLDSQVKATIPNIAYSQFYVTPKFSY